MLTMEGNVDVIYEDRSLYFADEETDLKVSSYWLQKTEIVCDNNWY